MAHRKQGFTYENDWTLDEMNKVLDTLESGIIVPVYTEIKADQKILNYDNVKKYITNATKIAVLDCDCRAKKKHCDAPLDVCMVFDGSAERILSSEKYVPLHPFEIDAKKALGVLKSASESGLVHIAYVGKNDKGKVETICSCCSCCCENLGATIRYGLAPHLYKASATTSTDLSSCIACGVCAKRCHFGAREVVNGSLVYNPNLCYGCGLCVSTCPSNAISLRQLS